MDQILILVLTLGIRMVSAKLLIVLPGFRVTLGFLPMH